MDEKINIITYDCPDCGANIKIKAGQRSVCCEYCGREFEIKRDEQFQGAMNRASQQMNQQPINTQQRRNPNSAKILALCIAFGGAIILGCFLFFVTLISSIGEKTQRQYTEHITEKNPFENLSIKMEGMEPWARVYKISGLTEPHGIEYSVDKSSAISNGDVITVRVNEMTGYKWTEETYQYTVEGLDVLITDTDQFDEEKKEMLYSECQKELEKEWEKDFEGLELSKESIKLKVEPYKIYVNIKKEKEYTSYPSNNIVMPAYETTFEINGKTHTIYQYVSVENMYIGTDGNLHGDFDTLDSYNGYIYSCDLGFEESFGVSGYESVLKMESSMEEDLYNLKKSN